MRARRNSVVATIALLILTGITAWGRGTQGEEPDQAVRIVATTNIIGDVVSAVVGDVAAVMVLIGPGDNPHSYEPTPSDFRALERSDVTFVNGVGLEEALLEDISAIRDVRMVALSEQAHGVDPHVWMDPNNVVNWVGTITETLAEIDPDHEAEYRANGGAYTAEISILDRWIRDRVSGIEDDQRRLVLGHDSLAYFARAYGFQIIGAVVPSTSGTVDPSARAIVALVELVRESGTRAIFVERDAAASLQDLAKRITDEIGHDVEVIQLQTSSLAAPGEPGDTYLGMMRYNVEQILRGLEAGN